MRTEALTLLRLQSWLSPAFPTGGYAYSHGLEQAVEAGRVAGLDELLDWIDAVLRLGAGRLDASFLVAAWPALGDEAELVAVAELAAAMRGSAELELEARAQGQAFLATVRAAWPAPALERAAEVLARARIPPTLPVAVGLAAAAHGLAPEPTALAYLQAFAANLLHAAQRLMPIGQTDAQRALARLEGAMIEAAEAGLAAPPERLGAATMMVELSSMAHETQYARLFRS